MFEFTGQYNGHWVDKSYCPWFIEPYVVGYGQMLENIWKRETFSVIVVLNGSLEYWKCVGFVCWIYMRRLVALLNVCNLDELM